MLFIALNVFHSDRQSGPVVGPHPRYIVHSANTVRFHEWAVDFKYTNSILDEIVEIYREVAFGKGYRKRCPNLDNKSMKNHLEGGKRIIVVNIKYDKDEKTLLPEGFNTKYEKYSLEVNSRGEINISAKYYPGIIRALDTFSQLTKNEEMEGEYVIEYTPIKVHDEPSYPYRGVMLDTSREYFFPETLKQMLDGMMISRLNVFHWHIMDSDSFPMYLESYPDMTKYTAFSSREVYTGRMIQDIVKYAKIRGIKVIPEINGPGNVNILGNYPPFKDIIDCYRKPVVNGNAYGSPAGGTFNPLNEKTYEFYQKVMGEVHKSFDWEFCHYGGILPEGECWEKLEGTARFVHEGGYQYRDLNQMFNFKRKEIINKMRGNMTTIYWYQPDNLKYDEDDILQYWGDIEFLNNELNAHPKNKFILSHSNLHASCGYPNPFGFSSNDCPPKSYINVFTELSSYQNNSQILGVEVLLWSEMNNEFDFLTKLNPGSGIASFNFWNPKYMPIEGSRSEYIMRLQYRLKAYGVPTSKISMRYCEEHTHHCFGI